MTDKLTYISDRIYCCRSGSAADTQAVADVVSYQVNLASVISGKPPTVKGAAATFQNILYTNRDGLMAGIICAGWDERDGGSVYTLPLGGMCVRQPFAMGGSGSTYLFGHVDATFKPGMTKEECFKWVAGCVTLAIERDGSSGGCVRLAAITRDGVERHVSSFAHCSAVSLPCR